MVLAAPGPVPLGGLRIPCSRSRNTTALFRSSFLVIPHLQVGQVSQPLRKPLGWQIFKLTSKRMVPLSEARPFLANLRMKDWREELMSSIHSQLNEEYFGPPDAGTDVGPTEPR